MTRRLSAASDGSFRIASGRLMKFPISLMIGDKNVLLMPVFALLNRLSRFSQSQSDSLKIYP